LDNIKFSYIEPRKKQLISAEVGLVLSFFTVLFIFVTIIFSYLSFQLHTFNKEKIALKHEIEQNNFYANEVAKDIKILQLNLKLSKELNDSVGDIKKDFDDITDSIKRNLN
jgi:hypothetical protein